MKTSAKVILSLFILILIGCSSTKKSLDKAHFELMEAYAKPWVSGIKGGGSGIEYTFVLKVGKISNISFGDIWVNNQKLSSKVVKDNMLLTDQRTIVSGDQVKLRCSGEKVATKEEHAPKPLAANQSLISYYLNDSSIKYFLVETMDIKKDENRQ